MNWYYVDTGQQAGPVSEEELNTLVANGKVRPDTLVWREGMENWQPYGQVNPASAPAPAAAPPAGLYPTQEPTAAPAPASGLEGGVVCAECNNIFPREEAIQYGSVWVCASCKPVFVQKLKEGAVALSAGPMAYGGFWIRFLAKMIDGLILGFCIMLPLVIILFMTLGMGRAGGGQPDETVMMLFQVIFQLAAIIGAVAYNTFFIGKWGATPGKMACKLRVLTPEGQKVTFLRAFGRAWGEQLSGLVCNIGYIIAAFDDQKRTLHDHICNTRVVRNQ